MGTLNVRKILKLVAPEQPVQMWTSLSLHTDDYCYYLRRISFRGNSTAEKEGLTNKRLPEGCDINHPMVVVTPVIFFGHDSFYNLQDFNKIFEDYIRVSDIYEEYLAYENAIDEIEHQRSKEITKLLSNVIAKNNGITNKTDQP